MPVQPVAWTGRYAKKTGKPMCGRQVDGQYVCRGSIAARVGASVKCPQCGVVNVVPPKDSD
jgi:hypothetical protein